MLKALTVSLLITLLSMQVSAQIIDGHPFDSSTIRFTGFGPDTLLVSDTGVTPLWQIGTTHKSFFANDTLGCFAIMTDTLHAYPPNANNFFILNFSHSWNIPGIIDFWHRYQTNGIHAGGIVEFSVDSGLTWQNVKGDCNADVYFHAAGVHTSGFYSTTDTIFNGTPAFSGTTSSQVYSRFQFWPGDPVKRTVDSCNFNSNNFLVRFSFVSDALTDTLAGWIIDSIKLESDIYDGGVAGLTKAGTLNVFPNPSSDGTFNFPVLTEEKQYSIAIYNSLGQLIETALYQHTMSISNQPPGIYFYRVSGNSLCYSGIIKSE